MPTYNGSLWISETIESILKQNFKDWRMLIGDDHSTDDTVKIISAFRDQRICIYQNKKNLGYGRNLQHLTKKAGGEILFLMGQDDILLPGALERTVKAFADETIGAVTRPYYWFDNNYKMPVRRVLSFDAKHDRKISVLDGKKETQKIFESLGQLSGLAYRRKYLNTGFHEEIFPSHIYPFAAITKKHKIMFLKDYTVAVRVVSSQTRSNPRVYDVSPTISWVKMFNTVYPEKKFAPVRQWGIDQIATHFVGLVQIKNYSTYENLLREIIILIRLHPANLINPKFWFYSLGTLIIPRRLLAFLVDKLKKIW